MTTKRQTIIDFVEELLSDEFAMLWNEYHGKGLSDIGIEYTGDIDELWRPSELLEYDLSDFNILHNYYIIDFWDSLISSDFPLDLVRDHEPDEYNDFIEWLCDMDVNSYDGYIDGFRDLLTEIERDGVA